MGVSTVSDTSLSPPISWRNVIIAFVPAVLMVVLSAADVAPLFALALATALIYVFSGLVTLKQAYSSIRWNIVILIGASFTLGLALDDTKAAGKIGKLLLDIFSPLGSIGVIVGIYVATALMTSVISNAAAIAIMFPIGVTLIGDSVTYRQMMYSLMMAASAGFTMPFSYQTNLMVQGPGGYRVADFVKLGLPLQLVV